MIDWDDAYDNVGHIPDSASYPPEWTEQARTYRELPEYAELDVPYGRHDREKYDLFFPSATALGIVVFIHGGYWMRLDKSFWSHLAEGARSRGWSVAIPSYVLAPEARISQITARVGAAISRICAEHDGPLRLVGHSAGGQLVTRMACEDSPLPGAVRERLAHVMSISGLHDLRPLLKTSMNRTLGLTPQEAEQESACLQAPLKAISMTAWVGSDERPEYLRQMQLLLDCWKPRGAHIEGIIEPGHHHFSVVDGLKDSGSEIVRTLLA